MKQTDFAVKTKNFSLYEAFKKEVEKLGYRYEHDFSSFDESSMFHCDCLYFGDFYGKPSTFAFSNCSQVPVFRLPEDWHDALKFAHNNNAPREVSIKTINRVMAEIELADFHKVDKVIITG